MDWSDILLCGLFGFWVIAACGEMLITVLGPFILLILAACGLWISVKVIGVSWTIALAAYGLLVFIYKLRKSQAKEE